jgi:hypothetical protein
MKILKKRTPAIREQDRIAVFVGGGTPLEERNIFDRADIEPPLHLFGDAYYSQAGPRRNADGGNFLLDARLGREQPVFQLRPTGTVKTGLP